MRELIERLRWLAADLMRVPSLNRSNNARTVTEAADAIEAKDREIERLKFNNDELNDGVTHDDQLINELRASLSKLRGEVIEECARVVEDFDRINSEARFFAETIRSLKDKAREE